MSYAAAAQAIFNVIKRVKAKMIAMDVADLDPSIEKCIENYYMDNAHTLDFSYQFGKDVKRKLSGKGKKRDGKYWYNGAGVNAGNSYAKALSACGAHPITIQIAKKEWFEFFGNKWSQQARDKEIARLRQLELQKAQGGTSPSSGGISPAILVGGAVIAFLLLKK